MVDQHERGPDDRFGFANGYRDALTSRELFGWTSDEAWWLTCPALQRHQGKVKPKVRRLAIDRAAGTFELEVRWHGSYEAAQHKRVVGRADAPVCWTLAGYASGFSTAVLGDEVLAIEQECAGQGRPTCRMVARTRRAWGAAGARHAAELSAGALARELEAREAELRRAARALKRQEAELRRLRGDADEPVPSRSRDMQRAVELARKVAAVDATVLITGESGVGKERIARLVHGASARARGPLVTVNCAALPETLLESELFGHVRGAFTGAATDRKGLFEAAAGGTIFLDEIGETSPATQAKLLRVLQEREVRAVGATRTVPVDVRVIAATNVDLDGEVARGAFRRDLYYRLKVVTIEVPPLRARREDVLPLARWFLARACRAHRVAARALAPDAAAALAAHTWPGNVRELEHAIEHALVLAGDAPAIAAEHLPASVRDRAAASPATTPDTTLAELERAHVLATLERHGGHRARTARALGIGTNTLWRKLSAWGVAGAPPARGGC